MVLYDGAWYTGFEIGEIWYGVVMDSRYTLLIKDDKIFRTYNTNNIEDELRADLEG